MPRALVVEDDSHMNRLFRTVLAKNGIDSRGAANTDQALRALQEESFDVVLCDVMMPGRDGFSLTRTMRAAGFDVPILMITARGTIADKEQGFFAGVDDYMVKPVDVKELVLRVRALLRRAGARDSRQLKIGQVILDTGGLSVSQGGNAIELPLKEFNILHKLLSSPGQIFTRQQLMDEFWGVDSDTDERTIDVHISRIRDRFRDTQDFSILTVRGLGYKAVVP